MTQRCQSTYTRGWKLVHSFCAFWVVLASAALSSDAQEPTTRFQVDVELVPVTVVVRDNNGKLVTDLDRDDFMVYDQNVPQEIALFERQTGLPLWISLLLDTSSSTVLRLDEELEAVEQFIELFLRHARPQDGLAIYSFSDEVILRTSHTTNKKRLRAALRSLKSGGGTSLYDAIVLSAEDASSRVGRHVIIAVTDGGDTTSRYSLKEALQTMHRYGVTFYAIQVIPMRSDAGRMVAAEHALALLASRTGGTVRLASLGEPLRESFAQLLKELRTQYLLGYYPTGVQPSANGFHQIRVEVKRCCYQVQARAGYYERSAQKRSPQGRTRPTVHLPVGGPRLQKAQNPSQR